MKEMIYQKYIRNHLPFNLSMNEHWSKKIYVLKRWSNQNTILIVRNDLHHDEYNLVSALHRII